MVFDVVKLLPYFLDSLVLQFKEVDARVIDYVSDIEDLVFLDLLNGFDLRKLSGLVSIRPQRLPLRVEVWELHLTGLVVSSGFKAQSLDKLGACHISGVQLSREQSLATLVRLYCPCHFN